MDAVYLIYDGKTVTIPMAGNDPALSGRLAAYGCFDRINSRFILRCPLKNEQYRMIFIGRPFVETDKDGQNIIVNGFFDRPWPREDLAADFELSEADRSCIVAKTPLPDKFPPFWAEKLKEELNSRKYSLKTVDSYLYFNQSLCRVLQKCPESIVEEDIKKYIAYLNTVKDLSSSSMNLAISAIRFFFNNVMKRNFTREQTRPRQDKRLPSVLSREEVNRLLENEKNPKHRLLLMLTYSSGLRVSEVIALKREHVDFNRKILLIHQGKGRKDRVTLLADRAATFLREYCRRFYIKDWLFPGQDKDHIQVRTAQNIFEKAARQAQIEKKVSIHSLRHTFATHLLELGTDIRYIQILLGHSCLRTTERYTHIARRSILRIKSPLDSSMDL